MSSFSLTLFFAQCINHKIEAENYLSRIQNDGKSCVRSPPNSEYRGSEWGFCKNDAVVQHSSSEWLEFGMRVSNSVAVTMARGRLRGCAMCAIAFSAGFDLLFPEIKV